MNEENILKAIEILRLRIEKETGKNCVIAVGLSEEKKEDEYQVITNCLCSQMKIKEYEQICFNMIRSMADYEVTYTEKDDDNYKTWD